MKTVISLFRLVLMLAVAAAGPAFAQEDPKKETPEAAAPEKAAEPAADAKPAEPEAAKKEAEPAAAAAPAAAVPAAAAAEAPKPLSAAAKSFSPLANTYKGAYDDMQKWMETVSAQTAASDEKITKLQKQISDNEAAITQAKLAGDDKKVKSLTSENKKLSSEASSAMKGLNSAKADFVKQAEQRVKQYQSASDAALTQVKNSSK
jgi:hypothetical protein